MPNAADIEGYLARMREWSDEDARGWLENGDEIACACIGSPWRDDGPCFCELNTPDARIPLLAVVPARGGSKGILRKNLQPINGKPLLLHTLEMLARVPEITGTVVSTEDAEIAGVCRTRGYKVIDRPAWLALDDVPIGPVAQHAVEQMGWPSNVGVFQPTSPTLTAETVSNAIREWQHSGAPSAGSVVADTHITWIPWEGRAPCRENRQYNETPMWQETGGFFFAQQVPIGDDDPLIGYPHLNIPIPAAEAVDVNDPAELEVARQMLGRKRIEFRYVESPEIGSGHARRCETLGQALWAHTVTSMDPDLVVFDRLDTSVEEVAALKADGVKVVTLEDLGPGSALADLVVNELYSDPRPHVLSGPRYAVLRHEFLALPAFEVRSVGMQPSDRGRIMVCFGGTDPAGLNERVAAELSGVTRNVSVVRSGDGTHMAEAMRSADLLFTSAGRTAHEAAAVGVPTVTIAANEREARHSHCAGIVRLGLGATVNGEAIWGTARRILESEQLRREMSHTARGQVDGLGARRIVHHIQSLLEGL